MKQLLLLLGVLLLAAPAGAQSSPPAARPPQKQNKDKGRPDTALEKTMDKMGGAFRKLRKQAKEGAFAADAADLVADMIGAATEAKKLEPIKTKDLPEADRAKFVADFRSKLDEFIAQLDRFSAELKAGDTTGALKSLEKLGKFQRSAHENFQPKDY
jgi:soluble cytochrome b562